MCLPKNHVMEIHVRQGIALHIIQEFFLNWFYYQKCFFLVFSIAIYVNALLKKMLNMFFVVFFFQDMLNGIKDLAEWFV